MSTYKKWVVILGVIVAAGLGVWLYMNYSEATEAAETKEVASVGAVVSSHFAGIKTSDFTSKDQKHIAQVFGGVWSSVQSPEYVRMKVWTPDFTVIWSNLPELIGQKFPPFDELGEATESKMPVGDLESQKQENVGERQYDVLLETYVPFVDASGTVPGFIELYKVPTALNQAAMSDFEQSLPVPIATAVIVFGVLAFALRFMTGKKEQTPTADAAHL